MEMTRGQPADAVGAAAGRNSTGGVFTRGIVPKPDHRRVPAATGSWADALLRDGEIRAEQVRHHPVGHPGIFPGWPRDRMRAPAGMGRGGTGRAMA